MNIPLTPTERDAIYEIFPRGSGVFTSGSGTVTDPRVETLTNKTLTATSLVMKDSI